MPLHDHFREPIASRRHWTAFHTSWATYTAESLNSILPEGYVAEPTVQLHIEIDVATWEEPGGPPRAPAIPGPSWSPPAPQLTAPFTATTDVIEVQILRNEGGLVLAAAVEFVSPANKDRPANREAFLSKCATYLHQGAGLVIVDVVTERAAHFHRELLARVLPGVVAVDDELFTASYRPVQRDGDSTLEVWHQSLALGQPLPTMPLWLRGGICLPLELEQTYERTIKVLRVPTNGA